MRTLGWAAVTIACCLSSPACAADLKPDFDRPLATQRIKARSGADPAWPWICTTYKDLMLREDGSDTPAPDNATLVALNQVGRLACSKQVMAGQITLDTEGFVFEGRKGGFLVFTLVDINGFMPSRVLHAGTGAVLFRDSMAINNGITSVALDGPALRLSYRRSIEGSCGLPKGGAACWASIVTAAAIPFEIATIGPPMQACAASYRRGKAPAEDPSIVSYNVTLTLDPTGAAKTTASRKIGCEPMP